MEALISRFTLNLLVPLQGWLDPATTTLIGGSFAPFRAHQAG